MKSQHPCSETRKIRAKLKPKRLQLASGCTTQTTLARFLMTKNPEEQSPKSATQGSVLSTRKQTSNAKSKTLRKRTASTRLSLKSQAASTDPGRSLMPFWRESWKELSRMLWLYTKTDCFDFSMNALPKFCASLMSNSWYTFKVERPNNQAESSSKTSCHSSQCL
jgi:hypothetical protein